MVIFLKCESVAEEDQCCQLCCHSPGSPSVCVSGRRPSGSSDQLGLHQNPCLSNRSVAMLSSAKLPSPGLMSSDMDCTTISATAGFLWAIKCKASAQDAQYAACAHLSADLKPRPPHPHGNDDSVRASSTASTVPGISPNSVRAVFQMPSSCWPPYSDEMGGECAACGWLLDWH